LRPQSVEAPSGSAPLLQLCKGALVCLLTKKIYRSLWEIVQILTPVVAGNSTIEQLTAIEFAYPTSAAVIGLAARQVARERGLIMVTPGWRVQSGQYLAEWERKD
jgi:hypothetical protein